MTPTEKLLHAQAVEVSDRADRYYLALHKASPNTPDRTARAQSLIMALLERDHAVTDKIEQTVRVSSLVDGASSQVEVSIDNMNALIADAQLDRCKFTRERTLDFVYGETLLFGYVVTREKKRVDVQIPGIPPANWLHVRCYIDGNSWMWRFAPNRLRDELGLKELAERQ